MISHTLDLTQALSNASHAIHSSSTPILDACHQSVPLLHDWNTVGVILFGIAVTFISLFCTMIIFGTEHTPSSTPDPTPEASALESTPEASTPDPAPEGPAHQQHCDRESAFLLCTAASVVLGTCAAMQVLVLQFSRFCVARSVDQNSAIACAIVANVCVWAQLPFALAAVLNLGRDVWAGRRIPEEERMPAWALYALPVMVPGYLLLGLIKGVRALKDQRGRNWEAYKMRMEALEAAGADGMLLPKYAEVEEQADGREQGAAGAWC